MSEQDEGYTLYRTLIGRPAKQMQVGDEVYLGGPKRHRVDKIVRKVREGLWLVIFDSGRQIDAERDVVKNIEGEEVPRERTIYRPRRLSQVA